MKNLFITGGSGTVGKAFIKNNIDKYNIFSFSRNEKAQVSLKRNFPQIEILFGSVEQKTELFNAFRISQPDIVVHAAALKHVDTAEKQPSLAIKSNILGSLNIIEASIEHNVRTTVGISTDKACSPDNVYGQTKYLMERLFREYDKKQNRFICCRFGNVAWSNGSVLPFWLGLAKENKTLPVTSETMTRLIFTSKEAADLIRYSIEIANDEAKFFILSKKMKKVNMLKMAKVISEDVEIVGLRPGEIEDEDLISDQEVFFTKEIDSNYLIITPDKQVEENLRLAEPLSSSNAPEMSLVEMKEILENLSTEKRSSYILDKNY